MTCRSTGSYSRVMIWKCTNIYITRDKSGCGFLKHQNSTHPCDPTIYDNSSFGHLLLCSLGVSKCTKTFIFDQNEYGLMAYGENVSAEVFCHRPYAVGFSFFLSISIPKRMKEPVRAATVFSSSCDDSGTRSSPVGPTGWAGLRALSAAAWWWTRWAWTHSPVRPAAAWNRACASFGTACAWGTMDHLTRRSRRLGSKKRACQNG